MAATVCGVWLLLSVGYGCYCLWGMAATVCGVWLLLSVGYGCYCLWDMAATVCGIWMLLSVGYGCYCLWDMAATVCGVWLLLSCPTITELLDEGLAFISSSSGHVISGNLIVRSRRGLLLGYLFKYVYIFKR